MSLILVFEIPDPRPEIVFRGEPHVFVNIDWFSDDDIMNDWLGGSGREQWELALRRSISRKDYARRGRPLLVLGGKWSFTIDYEAP